MIHFRGIHFYAVLRSTHSTFPVTVRIALSRLYSKCWVQHRRSAV